MMRAFFAGSLVLLGLVLIGCNRDNTPKRESGSDPALPTHNSSNDKKDNSTDPKSKEEAPSPQKSKDRKPDFALTAADLITEMNKNREGIRISADFLKKYDGKVIELTGKVWSVSRKSFSLEGASSTEYSEISCTPAEMIKVHRFSTGQKVKVICTGKNLNDLFFSLDDGIVTELEPSKIQRVSAETLAMDWDKSHEFDLEFGKKYGGVRWIVSGTVASTPKKTGADTYEFAVKGSQKTNIIAWVSSENDQGLPKVGDVIEFSASTFVNAKNSSARTKDADIRCHAILLSESKK